MPLFTFDRKLVALDHADEGTWLFVKSLSLGEPARPQSSVVASIAVIDGRCEASGRVDVTDEYNVLSIVDTVTGLALGLPDQTCLKVVTDEASFYRALPPNDNWLRLWKQGGFRKPAAGKLKWERLDSLCLRKGIELSAPKPSCAGDHAAIDELKKIANSYARPKDPIEHEDDDGLDEETELHRRRAIEKDR